MTILLEAGLGSAESVHFALPGEVTTVESVPAVLRHLADDRNELPNTLVETGRRKPKKPS